MTYTDCFLLLVRVLLGSTMLYHGWLKLADLKSASKSFKKMGFNPPMFWSTAFGINELFGGIFIITGFYAELFAILIGFEMLTTTLWQIMAQESFHKISYGLQMLVLSAALVIFGSGEYAIMPVDIGIFLEWWAVTLIIAISVILAYLNQPIPKTKPDTGE